MNNVSFIDSFQFRKFTFERAYSHDHRKQGTKWHYRAYMISGFGKLVSADSEYTLDLAPGDTFFIPKGTHYQSFWRSEGQIVFHSYAFAFLPATDHKKYRMQKLALADELADRVRCIPLAKTVDCEAVGALYSTLAAILPLMEADPLGSEAILCNKAIRCMTRHPHAAISDIAHKCGVSESGIYNAFRHVLGITPNTQRQILLCDRAIELLTTTNRPIEEISDALGFSSSSYFRKVLFSRTGQTPSEIRKKALF